MKKFYPVLFLLMMAFTHQLQAQTTFSFTCSRDTIITNCALSCITLLAKVPDVRSSTNTYVINPLSAQTGCYNNYVNPGAPGTPSNLNIDDRYSSLIALPFTFPFFGSNYGSLVASTNGYLSFDGTKAGAYSHWPISANLPSTTYDPALIMGPYHDLDPSVTTSPTQRIKYDVWGTAPNRRWILSFYKVPLFSCNALIENTHQIILYEGLGIVEVFINSKQQCTAWNAGKAIVGMQNFARTSGIMAPNRTATSPPWGTINMNESWRFVPSSGPSLFRKAELFTLSGTLVATGDTAGIGNSTLQVSFPNVCPSGTTTYIVRSEYEAFNNPALRIVGTDTVRVLRGNAVTVLSNVTNVTCNGNANGSIVLNPGGGVAPYQFSINNGPFQSSNTFSNLAPGVYNVSIKDNTVCTKDTVITILQPTVLNALTPHTDATCSVAGSITVTASGGTAPYTYSSNGTTFQASNVFNLQNGTYPVTIKDANGCTFSSPVIVLLNNDLTVQVKGDTTICAGGSARLNTISTATGFMWTPTTGLDNPTSANPLASPTISTSYTLTATLGQCTKTAPPVNINVVQQVFVSAGPDVSIVTGDKTQLNGSATNASSYLWTPAAGLNATNILSPIAQPTATTLYKLTVKNTNGCTATDSILVTVVPYCIKVKNAFSPNGDGINDVWVIYDQYDCLKNISLAVFNRYGNKVFESNDYRNKWDGRYKGDPIPDGTYYAVINFTLISGKALTIKTDLTIIR